MKARQRKMKAEQEKCRAEQEKRRAEISERGAELRKRKAEITKERDAYEAHLKKTENLMAQTEQFRRSLPEKNNMGRPKKWRGQLGFELVEQVNAVRKQNGSKTGIAAAIRIIQESSPRWREYKNRELAVRYQEAKKFWRPWIEQDRTIEAEMEEWRSVANMLRKPG